VDAVAKVKKIIGRRFRTKRHRARYAGTSLIRPRGPRR
jgi:hypothetical protein